MGQGQPWLKVKDSKPLPPATLLSLLVNICLCQWLVAQATAVPGVTMATTLTSRPVTPPGPVCPAVCNCTGRGRSGTTETVLCVGAGLTSIPHPLLPSTVSLHLSDNEIERVASNLTFLPQLEYLDLSNNSVSALSNDSLSDLYSLKYLDLSFNAIDAIAPKVFGRLGAMEELNIAYNQLTELNDELFLGLSNLRILNLTGNVIREVSNKTFLYLRHLQILDLSHNSLEELPHNAFQGLASVKYIYLQHNYLQSVQAVFNTLPNLQLLDLSHNMLESLQDGTFAGLSALTTLDLSFNNITQISPLFCGSAAPVKTLNLRNNAVRQLEGPAFGQFQQLRDLDLSQMPFLRSISHDAFNGMHSLEKLNLSYSPHLSFVHPQLLAKLPHLSVVDLRSCGLPTLSKVTFHGNPRLSSLYLGDNPLECDCGLAWIVDKAASESTVLKDFQELLCVAESGSTIDSSTPSLTPLHSMSQEMMQCNNVTLNNVTSSMSAKIGSQVVLVCDYDADETGVLTWLTPRGLVFHYHPFHPDATAHLTEVKDTENLTGEFHATHGWHDLSSYNSDLHSNTEHVILQSDGSLYIDYVLRSDGGPYQCMVHNSRYNATAIITLKLDYNVLFEVKKMSILVGIACAASFFTLNAVYAAIIWTANKLVNKRRRERLRNLLESLDVYRTAQMTRIRTNYSNQLGRIREHYHTQSMRLRLNYTTQMKRVRRGCSNQCERIRDNYHTRMGNLKDYSSHQIHQIREATNNQIVRIRDYGLLQMDRIRETYKLQQQHVIKILEAMNLDNCRSVVETECMRTESMIFDASFSPDFDDTSNEETEGTLSQNSPTESVYATALNSDGSSDDSLNTVINCLQVRELQVEVLPHAYQHTPLAETPPLVDDTLSSGSSQPETNEEDICVIDTLRETIV